MVLLLLMSWSLSAQTITEGEYFFDTDPGVGNGTAIPSFTTGDEIDLDLTIDATGLAVGFHNLFVRFKDADNKWGIHEGRIFYVQAANVSATAVADIADAEYFFDTDPGMGNGTAIPTFTAGDEIDLDLNIDATGLAVGFHNLFVRFRDADNKWGIHEGRIFYVEAANVSAAAVANIVDAEYFFDTDPGVGNGTAIPSFTAGDEIDLDLNIDASGLAEGTHDLFIRFRDEDNKWGIYEGREFAVVTCPIPVAAFTPSATSICEGSAVTLTDASTNVEASATYAWDFDDDGMIDDTTVGNVSHVFGSAGTYDITLTVDNQLGCIANIIQTVTVKAPETSTQTVVECESYTWIDGITYTASNNTATHTIVGGGSNGCDNLVTLDLTINNSTTSTDVQMACDSYIWIDGNTYTTSNNTAIFNQVGGGVNGCDNLVTLDLTINNTTSIDVQTACDSYTWIDGNTYTASNNTATFNQVGGGVAGCDNLVTLDLTINTNTTSTDVQTACESYTWIDGITYTVDNNTATFNQVGVGANGCDNLVTLDLTFSNGTTTTDVQTACDSYTWIDGITYTSDNNTATFNQVGEGANGCDNLVTLDLTINNNATSTDVQTACGSYTWIDGITYTSSNNTAIFNQVGEGANGCDNLVTLDLTINNTTTSTDVQTACGSYTWIDGIIYTSSNNTATFNQVGDGANGCDNLATLDLTLGTSTTSTDVQTACESYTWIDGITYTASNNIATFNQVGVGANGCDNLVTLDLTIHVVDASVTQSDLGITANAIGASYQWIDCKNNNAVISGETGQTMTISADGEYAVIVTENGCSQTSECISVGSAVTGFKDGLLTSVINLYPNPSNEYFNLNFDNEYKSALVTVYNTAGTQVIQKRFEQINGDITISTKSLMSGFYVVSIHVDDSNVIRKLLIE
jgi:plastocyanin